MELQFTSKDIQVLIDCIAKYYSAFDIRSLGRNLNISETEYFSPSMPNGILAEGFVNRVFQLSKQAELVSIIENHPTLKRKDILNKVSIDKTSEKILCKNILHLSDIHLGTKEDAQKYRMQLNTDLLLALNVKQIDFLVLSGDISNQSTKEQYDAAVEFIEGIITKFNVDRDKIIIVPGNHDLSWKVSKKSIVSSDKDTINFNKDIYRMRFDNFNKYFYKKICKKPYPSDYSKQGVLYEYEEEKIIFLGLNSAWQIDHINKYRSSIYINSMEGPLDKIIDRKYNDWFKVAVFHHPVTGEDSMNNDFLQLLMRHNFKVCMHGHIHEAKYDFCTYGNNKEIAIVGAGTFGAPDKEHVQGVPLQYNLIKLGLENNTMKVITRRKEKPDGAWEADARWGDKDKPDPFYNIDLLSLSKL
ncbi:metallophosphoesterase family protein [Clostridium tyrobutyricum]|uniref:metallophosphoesterase family protein n=1 Tax=Clostridium tyrobutyricum TaxID=1519 RepID=UPI001C380D66|nr:metallophosphoesterase [Clostridium tyrobutyricum]MBV4429692.1 metallophosphoesterase [Clostridium tyrobutyricum]MBV4444953.1 metallophosphoesterase [Clostridium tyrobutyricum]